MCVARGVASCSKRVVYDEYMTSLASQLTTILQEKDSNPYVVTVCVHVLDLLLLKNPNTVFSIFFPHLFSPLLFITKQPFFSSISLQPSSFPAIPTPPDLLTRVVRSATRILQVGSTMPRIVDAVSVLIPSLFHLYVFCLASKSLHIPPSTLGTLSFPLSISSSSSSFDPVQRLFPCFFPSSSTMTQNLALYGLHSTLMELSFFAPSPTHLKTWSGVSPRQLMFPPRVSTTLFCRAG